MSVVDITIHQAKIIIANIADSLTGLCVCVCVCVCVADVKEESSHLDQSTVRQGRGKLKIFLNLKRIFGTE